MKRSKNIGLLYIGLFLIFLITIFYILPHDKIIFFTIQYILAMFIFSFLSNRLSFIIFIAYILISAISYLTAGFIYSWETIVQLKAILYHIVTVSNIAIVFALVYLIKQIAIENENLKEQVDNLMHYIGSSKLLTKQEFVDRRNLLIKAMGRRRESGYEVYFFLDKINPKVRSVVFDKLTSIAIETFRYEYDLIGKWDDFSFVVLLQNTDEKGMKIALNRYFSKIHQYMNIKEDEIDIDIIYVGFKEGQVESA